MIGTASAPATALLIELARDGIELRAHGNRLRYRPRSAMTPELAARVKTCKPELLAILKGGATTTPERSPKGRQFAADSVDRGGVRWLTDDPGKPLPVGFVELACSQKALHPNTVAWCLRRSPK